MVAESLPGAQCRDIDRGIEEDRHFYSRQASESVTDANPALKESLICFGRRTVSGSLRDHEIKSAHNGFSLCCGRESFLGTSDLGRIKPEVLGNDSMMVRPWFIPLPSILNRVCTNRNSVCTDEKRVMGRTAGTKRVVHQFQRLRTCGRQPLRCAPTRPREPEPRDGSIRPLPAKCAQTAPPPYKLLGGCTPRETSGFPAGSRSTGPPDCRITPRRTA